jgi:aspartate/methionine/tyrosine aminotransferase
MEYSTSLSAWHLGLVRSSALSLAAAHTPALCAGCEDDDAVVEWLVKRHKVCLIPGSSCGSPGHVRAAFANLKPELCAEAAARLKAGLQELVAEGMPAVRGFLSQQ